MDSTAQDGERKVLDEPMPPPQESQLSLLGLLAYVASEKLKTDPVVKRIRSSSERKPVSSDGRIISLLQASSMSGNALIKHFSSNQANEIKRKFYYSCHMVPLCDHTTHSFGSEDKARTEMKRHLQRHLRNLLQAHNCVSSQEKYVLQTVEKQRIRSYHDTHSKKRLPKVEDKTHASEKENSENTRGSNLSTKTSLSKLLETSCDKDEFQMLRVIRPNSLSNGGLDSFPKTASSKPVASPLPSTPDNCNIKVEEPVVKCEETNDNHEDVTMKSIVDDSNIKKDSDVKEEKDKFVVFSRAPNEMVSHDHGYVGSFIHTQIKDESHNEFGKERKMSILEKELLKPCKPKPNNTAISISIKREFPVIEESPLSQHMTRELYGEMMACDVSSSTTPLPLVGSEVDFTPIDVSSQTFEDGSSVTEASSPKNAKGKAKFIGQSKGEKEMALKLIEEMKQQPIIEDLECRICNPARFFTAPSTLLSHYKSHAGIRPYICTICKAVFTRQHSLNYHMLIHTNQTRFTCDDCGRKFRHPSHFKEHRRRHTGESPFKCGDCNTSFKTRNTFKRHLRTRHCKLLTTQGEIFNLNSSLLASSQTVRNSQHKRDDFPNSRIVNVVANKGGGRLEECCNNGNQTVNKIISGCQMQAFVDGRDDQGKTRANATDYSISEAENANEVSIKTENSGNSIIPPTTETVVKSSILSTNDQSSEHPKSPKYELSHNVLYFDPDNGDCSTEFSENLSNVTLYSGDSNASVILTCVETKPQQAEPTSLPNLQQVVETVHPQPQKPLQTKTDPPPSFTTNPTSLSKDSWGDLMMEVLCLSNAVQTRASPPSTSEMN